MDGHHHLVWEAAFFNRPDDAGGGVVAAAQEIGICNRAGSHGFVAAVIFAQRTAMHADGLNGAQLAQFSQVHAERIIRLVDVAVCECQIFVMIPDFVPESRNL